MSFIQSPTDFSQGFNTNTDIFTRINLFRNLINLCDNSPEENLVIALDDQWGEGKTSFVKMMKGQIEKDYSDKFNAIYFDAFECDYHSDPFISISAEFYSLINKPESKLDGFKDTFINITKRVGAAALIGGLKAVINTTSAGLISGDKLIDATVNAGKDISDNLTGSLEEYIKKKITTASEEKEDISKFREILSKMHEESNKKTIFIIDELDRARPDYSLDLLEKIKHLFSVKGVIFILVMNRTQFEKCIEKRYGNIDSRMYLNKFINFFFTLPKIKQHDITRVNYYTKTTIYSYMSRLLSSNNVIEVGGVIHKTLCYLLDVNGCSLRECERCLSLLSIFKPSTGFINYYNEYSSSLAFVIFLKVYNPKLLDSFIEKTTDFKTVTSKINIFNNSTVHLPEVDILLKTINYHYLTEEELKKPEYAGVYPNLTLGGPDLSPFVYFDSNLKNFTLE
ncbi:P-loop NTPase fold protein [Pantoea stewartii]|uniref:KAP family P-loop NTPase fold protein n=1 Tax=Pantoea stewartii TaxID=66269 RepID=UPI00198056AA|nr:P-loop NTPase fold protein [Pantoea stewartii]